MPTGPVVAHGYDLRVHKQCRETFTPTLTLMHHPSFAEYWRSLHDRQDWDAYESFVRKSIDKAVDWVAKPGGGAELLLGDYVNFRIWANGKVSPLAQHCLDTAYLRSREALSVNAFERGLPGSFPMNRFEFLARKIFIDGFALRQPLDAEVANQLAVAQEQIAPTYGRREWDSSPQSDYLHTIEILLLVDAVDRAQSMLKAARGLRGLHVREIADVLKVIAKVGREVRKDESFRDQYRASFDLLRSPHYADHLKGHPGGNWRLLTMACIWQKFFEPGDGTYDLDKAIDLLWE